MLPDLSWSGWSTLASIAVAVIPALLKFRAGLTRAIDLFAEFIGLIVLLFGLLLYAVTLPDFQRIHVDIRQMSAESPELAAQRIHTVWTLYAGSIGLMVLGGLLAISGLLGRLRMSQKRKRF